MSKPLTFLLLGATGETGSQVLSSLLSLPASTSIHLLGRKAPALPSPTPTNLTTTSIDFDKLIDGNKDEEDKFKKVEADVVVITLGTTRAQAGSFEKFRLIDQEYVVAAAKAARIENRPQKILYCSSGGADSRAPFPYPRSKGETEEHLSLLGYNETVIFRPGLLVVPGGRKEGRFMESMAAKVTGLLSHFTSSVQIPTPLVGSAFVKAGLTGVEGMRKLGLGKEEILGQKKGVVWALKNAEIMKLSETEV